MYSSLRLVTDFDKGTTLTQSLTVGDAACKASAAPSHPFPGPGAQKGHPARNRTESGRKHQFSLLASHLWFPNFWRNAPSLTFMKSLTRSSSRRKSLHSSIHCDTRYRTFRFLSRASLPSSFPLHCLVQ